MSNHKQNRVLGRTGAHELTKEQTENVGGGIPTLLSVIITGQGTDQIHDT
jgi:acyl CoA:acetate/3-ketoacid CoA transferase